MIVCVTILTMELKEALTHSSHALTSVVLACAQLLSHIRTETKLKQTPHDGTRTLRYNLKIHARG